MPYKEFNIDFRNDKLFLTSYVSLRQTTLGNKDLGYFHVFDTVIITNQFTILEVH